MGGGLLGWATFPSSYASQPLTDGVVMLNASLPGGSPRRTTWATPAPTRSVTGWACITRSRAAAQQARRLVSDTPAETVAGLRLPDGRDTCTSAMPGLDPITNFMDYTDDACMNTFSAGQAARMNAQWTAYR